MGSGNWVCWTPLPLKGFQSWCWSQILFFLYKTFCLHKDVHAAGYTLLFCWLGWGWPALHSQDGVNREWLGYRGFAKCQLSPGLPSSPVSFPPTWFFHLCTVWAWGIIPRVSDWWGWRSWEVPWPSSSFWILPWARVHKRLIERLGNRWMNRRMAGAHFLYLEWCITFLLTAYHLLSILYKSLLICQCLVGHWCPYKGKETSSYAPFPKIQHCLVPTWI